MKRTRLLALIAITLLLAITIYAVVQSRHQPSTSSTQPTISINNYQFNLTIAETPQQQLDGLSGWTHLEPNQGMYFPLNNRHTSFWMKDMLIDIDIIWIDENQIVGINHRVPAPEPGTPDAKLPSYPSPVPQPDGVLEIAAGRAEELGIVVGDRVELSLN